jgi:hypothetical protein
MRPKGPEIVRILHKRALTNDVYFLNIIHPGDFEEKYAPNAP